MDPTALMGHAGIDRLHRRRQAGTAVGHDQLRRPAFEAAAIEILQQALPGRLAFAGAPREGEYLPRPIRPLEGMGTDGSFFMLSS
jgi:hypothetical protein